MYQNLPSASTGEKSNLGNCAFLGSMLRQISELCLKVSLSKGSTMYGTFKSGNSKEHVSSARCKGDTKMRSGLKSL